MFSTRMKINRLFPTIIQTPTRCNNNGLLINTIISTCFGRRFRPSSGALDFVYSLWYNAPTKLPAGSLDAVPPRRFRSSSGALDCVYSLWYNASTMLSAGSLDAVPPRRFRPSSGTLDCFYSLWYNASTMLPAGGRQHRGCIIRQAVNTV